MTCAVCADHGIIRMRYHNGDTDEFALCLCDAGRAWRHDQNGRRTVAPLWHTWAAREQIAPERIGLIEEWHSEAELRALFPALLSALMATPDDLVIAAGRSRRDKRA